MKALPVRVPSGSTYWTVLDDELRVVVEADAFLRELGLRRSRAVGTTKSSAGVHGGYAPLHYGFASRIRGEISKRITEGSPQILDRSQSALIRMG